ncbi:MAG: excinuclease ABC subunit UvrC [Actinobacteria bacterium]|nr:excinuclease ABC subunit UvrC [Actinomycetota bacterium]
MLVSEVKEKVNLMPSGPGVYIFKDLNEVPIYIGKAKSIKKRVMSYFQDSRTLLPDKQAMLGSASSLDFLETDNEVEALLAEFNLIKKHRPKFNVSLRDDKKYPYIAITADEDFPRVIFTRDLNISGARYFGPFTSAKTLRKTIESLRKIFPIRTCAGKTPGKGTGRPCLNFHIGMCHAPCIGNISKSEYAMIVSQIMLFLKGRHKELFIELEKRMKDYSLKQEYERAAKIRDRIAALKSVLGDQKVYQMEGDFDSVAIFMGDDVACAEVFKFRYGKISLRDSFFLEIFREAGIETCLQYFIKAYYQSAVFIPPFIYIEQEVEDQAFLEQWLSSEKGTKVSLIVPKRGEKKRIIELVKKNARSNLELEVQKRNLGGAVDMKPLEELKRSLSMEIVPRRIECYDISNISGTSAVGSMVVFIDGKASRSYYRKFKIRSVSGQDDFAMLAEVIERRFSRLLDGAAVNGFGYIPDLVMVDGGKGQVSVVKQKLIEIGWGDINVIGIVKKFEEIYKDEGLELADLARNSDALKLLIKVRNEAHRFAVTYHKKVRTEVMLESTIEAIPGIGKVKRMILIEKFNTHQAIRQASLDELLSIKGINKKDAEDIYNFFHRF